MSSVNPALAAFLDGQPMPAVPSLPLDLEVVPAAGNRVADVLLLLGLIAAFWAIGRLLKGAGLPKLRPSVFAAGLTAILTLFFSNSAFWMVAGVKADSEKVTLVSWLGSDDVMRWADLRSVELTSGKLFPAFSDDTSVVLVGVNDQRLKLPRFVPGIERVVPLVAAHVPDLPSPAPPK